MPTSDQRLEKLKKLLEVATEDVATPADLLNLTETLVTVIAKEREKLHAKLAEQKDDTDGAIASALQSLDQKERAIRTLIDQLSRTISENATTLQNRLTSELQRLERKIPTRTDLGGIERQIEAIQEALTTVPTEITANPQAVRDALELLSEDDRLDIGAIRGLENYAELVELMKTVHPSNFNLGKVLRSLRAGTGITIDNSDPNNPVISASTTGGSAVTGQATIDFGAVTTENSIARVTVSTTDVASDSIITVSPAGVATADHDPDDYQWDGISGYATNIIDGVSFDIVGVAPNGTWGDYVFNYVIN